VSAVRDRPEVYNAANSAATGGRRHLPDLCQVPHPHAPSHSHRRADTNRGSLKGSCSCCVSDVTKLEAHGRCCRRATLAGVTAGKSNLTRELKHLFRSMTLRRNLPPVRYVVGVSCAGVSSHHGATLNVDVDNSYHARLFQRSKLASSVAAERIVRVEEGDIECWLDTHLAKLTLRKHKRGERPPYGAFLFELPKHALKRFPILVEHDDRGKLVGVTILKPIPPRLAASRDRTAFRRCSPGIDKPAPGGSRPECPPRPAPRAPRRSKYSCRSTSPRGPQLREPAAPALASCGHLRCQRRRRPIVERAVQVPEHFQCRLVRCFGYEPRDLPPITDENDLLLLMLDAIKDCAEVACDLGDGERFHR